MPGTYAHIVAAQTARSRVKEFGLSAAHESAVGKWLGYVELGALSPDYPYLSLTKRHTAWADCMHWRRTSTFLINATLAISELEDAAKEKATAWLFGFAAHMALDATIHPIIEEMVGPWQINKTRHRMCEMHQDVYIFPRLNLGETAWTKHLDFGVARCINESTGSLDTTIDSMWSSILCRTHKSQVGFSEPTPAKWHRDFLRLLRTMRTVNRHFAFARHVAANKSLSFPFDPAQAFIANLPTPEGGMDYDAIFDRGIENIGTTWRAINGALQGDPSDIKRMGDWNLDTGKNAKTAKFVFWRES